MTKDKLDFLQNGWQDTEEKRKSRIAGSLNMIENAIASLSEYEHDTWTDDNGQKHSHRESVQKSVAASLKSLRIDLDGAQERIKELERELARYKSVVSTVSQSVTEIDDAIGAL